MHGPAYSQVDMHIGCTSQLFDRRMSTYTTVELQVPRFSICKLAALRSSNMSLHQRGGLDQANNFSK